ncbi:MAG: XTP/dITP diphosphatase [Planctomycetes bacterium]|nr:XTP/dITP diphosphatase [Planctomycetota bacterium]
MRRILIATTNPHKLREVHEILDGLPVELITPAETAPLPEVIEDGRTFKENAVKKAVECARFTGEWTVADDSGLEVDALGGEPGVRSARYAGEDVSYENNNRKLLDALKGIPKERRTARFICVIALAGPEGLVFVVEGECSGVISEEHRGEHGFGYDPVFYPRGHTKTFAELGSEAKNKISHRSRALGKFREKLLALIERPL